jgi:hypothetical protein
MVDRVYETIVAITDSPALKPTELLPHAKNLEIEKYYWALPRTMLMQSYTSLRLDIEGAYAWIAENRSELGRHAVTLANSRG